MTVKIERATLKDLSDIQHLNNKLFELELANFDQNLISNWPLSKEGKAYFSDMIENHFVLIAKDDNRTVGYFAGTIGVKEFYTKGLLAEMDNMFVEEKERGQGVGKMFLDAFKNECVKQNISAIRVSASAKNKNAIAFYEKTGFEVHNITLNQKLNQ
ncbi:hypothetical protein FACS1894186_6300 [Alphaproteobacteria bacterium]|nr:hypothetical protein FACS1894186_6300 [Alphaproteobacteria bacterium]